MDIISVAVCDDEIILLPQLAAMIRDYFLQAGFTPEVDSYADAAGLLRDVYSRKRHDVYFLDIDIPEHSGIEIAERIAEVYPDAVLCFVSGQEDRILDTFHVRPVAFVRKSCFSEDIVRALSTIKKKLHKPEERMASYRDELGHIKTLSVDRTIYIEAKEKYQDVVGLDGSEMVRCAIGELEKILVPYGFVRTHRSYLVNLKFVYRIDASDIVLDSHQRLPLSRHRKKDVQERFLDFCKTL